MGERTDNPAIEDKRERWIVKRCLKIIKSINTSKGKLFEIKVNSEVIRIVLTWHALDGADDYNISANEFRGGIYEDKILPWCRCFWYKNKWWKAGLWRRSRGRDGITLYEGGEIS